MKRAKRIGDSPAVAPAPAGETAKSSRQQAERYENESGHAVAGEPTQFGRRVGVCSLRLPTGALRTPSRTTRPAFAPRCRR